VNLEATVAEPVKLPVGAGATEVFCSTTCLLTASFSHWIIRSAIWKLFRSCIIPSESVCPRYELSREFGRVDTAGRVQLCRRVWASCSHRRLVGRMPTVHALLRRAAGPRVRQWASARPSWRRQCSMAEPKLAPIAGTRAWRATMSRTTRSTSDTRGV